MQKAESNAPRLFFADKKTGYSPATKLATLFLAALAFVLLALILGALVLALILGALGALVAALSTSVAAALIAALAALVAAHAATLVSTLIAALAAATLVTAALIAALVSREEVHEHSDVLRMRFGCLVTAAYCFSSQLFLESTLGNRCVTLP
jgi:hypothetical protein